MIVDCIGDQQTGAIDVLLAEKNCAMNHGSTTLLSLIADLSDIRNKEMLLQHFVEALPAIFPEASFKWHKNAPESKEPAVQLRSKSQVHGFISYPTTWSKKHDQLNELQQALKLLVVLIEKLELEAGSTDQKIVIDQANQGATRQEEVANTTIDDDFLVKSQTESLAETEEALTNNAEKIKNAFENQNEIFRNALNRINAYVYLKDTEGHYTYANNHTLEFFKCHPNELIGKTDYDFFTPELAARLQHIDKEVISKGIDTDNEVQGKDLNGENVYYREIKTPIFDLTDSKKVIGLYGICTDISWQKQAEADLKHSHNLLKYIIEHNRGSVAVFDRNMNYVFVSQHYLDDFNISADTNIIGRNHYELFPYLPEKFRKAHQRALQGETISGNNDELIHPDGTIEWKQWDCRPWYAADGTVGGIILYAEDITERKLSEAALKESEKNYRELINGMNETVWVIDFQGNLLDVNETAIQTMGYTKDELLQIGLYGIDASLKKEMIVELAKTMPDDQLQIFETTHKTKEGQIIPVEIYSSIVTYQGKRAILSIARDITQRKQMEQQLRESEETIRLLFNSTAEGIYGIDTEGICTFCNRAALKMLGYENEDEVIGKNMHELMHHSRSDGSSYSISECSINKAFKSKSGTHADDEVFWSKNGSSFAVEYWSYPIVRNKKIIGAVVTFIDISQRKHDEEVNQILYEIARTSMSANAIEEMLGVVRHELSKVIDTTNFYVAMYKAASNSLRKIIYVNEKQSLEEWDVRNTLSGEVLRSKKTLLLTENEISVFRKKNGLAYLSEQVKCWLGVPLVDNQQVIGVMVVQSYTNKDAFNKGHARFLEIVAHELSTVVQRKQMIQDLIKAKEKAEESDRLKSSFLANLSHEIRTPMNSIMGFASLLPEEDDNALIKQYAEIIVRNSEQLVHIIDDIVLYSRLQTRLLTYNPSEFSAERLFSDIVQSFNLPEFTDKAMLQIDPKSDGKILIHSDYEKLRQVITNLVFNAFKYTPEGSITIGVERQANELRFFVRDTGIGIPANEVKKIFERFYRASNVDKGAISGTGLGLSIVKELIELAGGSIWVESDPDEKSAKKGSTFFFTIPD